MTIAEATIPITLELHVDLYPRAAIDRAIADFAGLGEFGIEAVGRYHRVTIRSSAGDGALGRDFANHVLSLAVVGEAGVKAAGAGMPDADAP